MSTLRHRGSHLRSAPESDGLPPVREMSGRGALWRNTGEPPGRAHSPVVRLPSDLYARVCVGAARAHTQMCRGICSPIPCSFHGEGSPRKETGTSSSRAGSANWRVRTGCWNWARTHPSVMPSVAGATGARFRSVACQITALAQLRAEGARLLGAAGRSSRLTRRGPLQRHP